MSLQTIYDALRSSGFSRWGALASMGNFSAESGCEAVRLEGDFDPARRVSKEWAADVDSGKKSRNNVIYMGRGWGLAQWTFWSRLAGLYDLCKSKGKSIGDESVQIEWYLTELKNGYPSLLAFLKTCNESDLYTAVSRVCVEFERPAVNNVQARYNAALEIAKQVTDSQPEPEPTPAPEPKCWPPRGFKGGKDDPGMCIGMSGPDVEVLQAVLKARGYAINYISGTFDDLLDQEVRKFQKNSGLTADGVVGPLTWSKLFER